MTVAEKTKYLAFQSISLHILQCPDGTTGTYGTYYVRIIEETAKLATELAKQYSPDIYLIRR